MMRVQTSFLLASADLASPKLFGDESKEVGSGGEIEDTIALGVEIRVSISSSLLLNF